MVTKEITVDLIEENIHTPIASYEVLLVSSFNPTSKRNFLSTSKKEALILEDTSRFMMLMSDSSWSYRFASFLKMVIQC